LFAARIDDPSGRFIAVIAEICEKDVALANSVDSAKLKAKKKVRKSRPIVAGFLGKNRNRRDITQKSQVFLRERKKY